MQVLNNKKIMNGWVMYDWANSVYSLTIATAVFPTYFSAVVDENVNFLGINLSREALYAYLVSFSFLAVAFLSPLLSGIADYKGNKKAFMKFFCYAGSLSCAALYFFDGSNIHLGAWPFVLATISFAGSLVFYNAFLPEIATPDRMDQLSARGYSMGYIGGLVLLGINLLMIQKPDLFGLEGSMPARISFITVGIWWAGFAQMTFRVLPDKLHKNHTGQSITNGFKELLKAFNLAKKDKYLFNFLISFFIYSMGLQTVMFLATQYGEHEIGLKTAELITTVMIIQVLGSVGSYTFSFLSKKYGNVLSISVSLAIWVAVCIVAYMLKHGDNTGFYVIGAMVGFVMGGIQSQSRSTYSKLLPETEDHASFFSFYDFLEKIAIVLGTFLWGMLRDVTGDLRTMIIFLGIFFVIGWFVLLTVRSPKLRPTKS